MSQLNFHNNKNLGTPPPRQVKLPIIQHLVTAYQIWHTFLPHVPKDLRYTLGEKIDILFIETIELIFTATYLSKEQKLPSLQRAATKLDLAKFFLEILWESRGLDNKKYILLSEKLYDIGKMLGGWIRQVITPPESSRAGAK